MLEKALQTLDARQRHVAKGLRPVVAVPEGDLPLRDLLQLRVSLGA
jgi:hypothetical protein